MTAKSWSQVLAIMCSALFVTLAVWGQAVKPRTKYDPSKEVKIKGTVSEVKEGATANEPTVLVVKSADKTVLVQLAPAAFLKEIECWVKAGDEVQVTGAKVPEAAEDTVMAREVTFGNNTMVLRDQKGTPIWEGWKPGKAGA
jgi:hypothetical protein